MSGCKISKVELRPTGVNDKIALCIAVMKGVDKAWVETKIKRGRQFFEIVADGEFAGIIAIQRYKSWLYEVTDLFVRPSMRGMGIATKAVSLLLDNLRETMNVSRAIVYATVVETNRPAIRVFEKNGFEKIDVIEKYVDDGNTIRFVVFERVIVRG